ncbi:hypothetical protein F7725_023545, partial [Dissostichus mawsoni]
MVYSLLAASFSVHVADVLQPCTSLNTCSLRLFSVSIIFLWLRLMKHVRAFSMQSVPSLLYSLYRITLVDEYEFSEMMQRDDIMAPLLCGSFLAASSI